MHTALCANMHRKDPEREHVGMLRAALLGSEILHPFCIPFSVSFLLSLFFAMSIYCFYNWERVET
jgi:hypothetical protein